MGVALNTVGVNASVDDRGRIVRWFDKEAAFDVLSGPWFETMPGATDPLPWTLDGVAPNSPTFFWNDGDRSATKRVTAGYRSLAVDLDCSAGGVTCVLELTVGPGDRVEEFDTGVVVISRRSVIRAEWRRWGWSIDRVDASLRVTVPAGDSVRVSVSVADGLSRRQPPPRPMPG